MNYIDIYLQRNNLRKFDIIEKFNISENLFSNYKNKKIEKYSTEVIMTLATVLNRKPGEVLNELLLLEKENPAFEVFNSDDLLLALNEKYNLITIKGDYYDEIYKLMKGHLTEKEKLGLELGSNGTITILAYVIESIVDLFTKFPKKDVEIDKKLRRYKIKELNNDSLTLEFKIDG